MNFLWTGIKRDNVAKIVPTLLYYAIIFEVSLKHLIRIWACLREILKGPKSLYVMLACLIL